MVQELNQDGKLPITDVFEIQHNIEHNYGALSKIEHNYVR